ncbi:MAG TPA: hypothetical protein VGD94_14825 [Vicinamibacterales bacterium]
MSNQDATRFIEILRQLTTTQFRDLAGARVTADVPVSERLLNDVIATSIPPDAPVRNVAIRPEGEDRFSVRIVPKMALIPAITLRLAIEAQPRLPESSVLVLRMITLGGLFGLASGAIAGMLPPGVRLEGERILVDLRDIAAHRGLADLFEYVMALQVHSDAGRVVVHVDAGVPPR